jgi:hypothetical protein
LLSALDEHERTVVHAALMKMIAAAEQFELKQAAEDGAQARPQRRRVNGKRARINDPGASPEVSGP